MPSPPNIPASSSAARGPAGASAAPGPRPRAALRRRLAAWLTGVPLAAGPRGWGVQAPGASASRPTAAARRAWAGLAALGLGMMASASTPAAGATLWLGGACASLAIALLGRGWTCRLALLLACVGLGAGWLALRVHERPRDSLAGLVADAAAVNPGAGSAGLPLVVEGFVRTPPRRVDPRPDAFRPPAFGPGPRTSFELALTAVHVRGAGPDAPDVGRPVSGRLEVAIAGAGAATEDAAPFRAGDWVRLRGTFAPVTGPLNPGQRDPRPWAAQEHRVGRLHVPGPELATRLAGPSAGSGVGPLTHAARHAAAGLGLLRARADAALRALTGGDAIADDGSDAPAPGAAILAALLLGVDEPGSAPLVDAFARLGLLHALCISGFHLVVLAMLLAGGLAVLGVPARAASGLVCAAVVVFLLVVPAETPVLRAGLMVLALRAAEASGRRYDARAVLALAAAGLLLWRPMDVFSAGFQLSVGVTLALLTLAEPLRLRLFRPAVIGTQAQRLARLDPGLRTPRQQVGLALQRLVTSCLLAWVVATPALMVHAGVVSPWAALASVLAAPLFVVLLGAGYALLALACAAPLLGGHAWALAAPARAGLMTLADLTGHAALALDAQPWMALAVPAIPPAWGVVATLVAAGLAARPRWWRGAGSWCAAGVLVWLAAILAQAGRLPPREWMRVDALASGNASALVIRAGPHAVLWTTAPDAAPFGRAGTRTRLEPALRAGGVWRVRTIVVPSARIQRPGELAALAQRLGARLVLVPADVVALARQEPGSNAGRLVAELTRRGVAARPVDAPLELALDDGVTLRLMPVEGGQTLAGVALAPEGRAFLAGSVRVRDAGDAAAGPAPEADELAALLASVPGGDEAAPVVFAEWPLTLARRASAAAGGGAARLLSRGPGPAGVAVVSAPSWEAAGVPDRVRVTGRDGRVGVRLDRDGGVRVVVGPAEGPVEGP